MTRERACQQAWHGHGAAVRLRSCRSAARDLWREALGSRRASPVLAFPRMPSV
jgi:hypothetical protein